MYLIELLLTFRRRQGPSGKNTFIFPPIPSRVPIPPLALYLYLFLDFYLLLIYYY